ncbi:DUF2164 domain-containing protein [Vibrio chagasii]|nr:DUF2164 domain-containing protein [Vibrio chagasii]
MSSVGLGQFDTEFLVDFISKSLVPFTTTRIEDAQGDGT